ncbi:50S ribosomal protein L10 [Marivirga arenosa]|uniref:Large ribosomal subunit protein uL10 n=1 Tax=Marivirga arenosa TaxID=3059076 RepID=A0AA49GGP0_9BACT|nr:MULTISPECIES: 50S ribosomal protein L10 [unclassified Marivirga]WKK87340.2 50S ribosomal protein L10 [Marivirga sp. ABR2-2]WNB18402.1 50S ribosomal protein L10 [Marivirga sp. BKB1-2]
MTRKEKGQLIEELTGKFTENPHFYLADGSGMTVAETNAFRQLVFERGLEYKVVKNSLIQKALENQEEDYSAMFGSLKGFSGILFSPEVGNAPAKVIKEFHKKNDTEKPLLKAAAIDTDVYVGAEHLTPLSELKSKKDMLGDIVGLLQSPAKNVISALQSGGHTVSGLVKALEERAQ